MKESKEKTISELSNDILKECKSRNIDFMGTYDPISDEMILSLRKGTHFNVKKFRGLEYAQPSFSEAFYLMLLKWVVKDFAQKIEDEEKYLKPEYGVDPRQF